MTDPSLDSSLATPAHLLCAPVYFSVLCLTFCFMPLSLCLRWEVVRELELAFPRYTPCLRGLQRWKVMQLRRLTCWMPILSFRDILPKYGNFYTYVHSCVHTHTHTHKILMLYKTELLDSKLAGVSCIENEENLILTIRFPLIEAAYCS